MRRAHRTHHGNVTVSPSSDVIGCNGKKQYPKFGDAERVSQLIRRNKDGERVQPYRCKHCQHFHVGGNGDHTMVRVRRKA